MSSPPPPLPPTRGGARLARTAHASASASAQCDSDAPKDKLAAICNAFVPHLSLGRCRKPMMSSCVSLCATACVCYRAWEARRRPQASGVPPPCSPCWVHTVFMDPSVARGRGEKTLTRDMERTPWPEEATEAPRAGAPLRVRSAEMRSASAPAVTAEPTRRTATLPRTEPSEPLGGHQAAATIASAFIPCGRGKVGRTR